jgi:HD-like signal output (HDOD) protein
LHPNMVVLSRLTQLLESGNSDLEDLARLIRTEPALALDVIRIANSPLFAMAEKCTEINTAVARIGYNEVHHVVGLILTRQICSTDLEKYGLDARDFWAECVAVSVLMDTLAGVVGVDPAEAATIGLIHAIGKAVINNILEDFKIDVFWDPYVPVSAWEREMVGFDYAEAGARLLKRWDFPAEIHHAVRFHLVPREAPRRSPLLDLLHYAVRLHNAAGPGLRKTEFVPPIYPPLSNRFEPGAVREIIDTARDAFAQTVDLVFSE